MAWPALAAAGSSIWPQLLGALGMAQQGGGGGGAIPGIGMSGVADMYPQAQGGTAGVTQPIAPPAARMGLANANPAWADREALQKQNDIQKKTAMFFAGARQFGTAFRGADKTPLNNVSRGYSPVIPMQAYQNPGHTALAALMAKIAGA